MSTADMHADLHADRSSQSLGPATVQPRRVWPWVLGGVALLTLLAAGSLAAWLLSLLDGLRDSAQVLINGETWDWTGWDDWGGGDWAGFGDFGLSGLIGFIVATLGVVLTGLLVALIVVPCVVLAVAAVLAVVLGSVGLVLALVFSPLWLFALVLWLIFRSRPQPAVA